MRRGVIVLALVVVAVFAWPTVRVVHEHTAHAIPVPEIVVHEHEVVRHTTTTRVACPPPRRDTPSAPPRSPPAPVDYVRPSVTDSGWIAAWSSEHAFVSTDAGMTWRPVPGRGEIRDVAFDCYGRAIVVRGGGIAIGERRIRAPDLDLARDVAVIGGGPDIVLVAHPHGPHDEPNNDARLAISRDGGASWEYWDLVPDWEGTTVYGRQRPSGAIQLLVQSSDCGGDSPNVFGRYSEYIAEYEAILGSERQVDGIDHPMAYTELLQGPSPILLADHIAYRYAHGKATPLPWKLSREADYHAVDASGRLWGIACGQLVIARAPRGSGPRGESSGAAAAGGCDPS